MTHCHFLGVLAGEEQVTTFKVVVQVENGAETETEQKINTT